MTRKLPKPAPNAAIYCFGSAGIGSGETTLPDRTLRFTSLGGDSCRTERTSVMHALSTLRPHAAVLRLCTPVCCFWCVSPLRKNAKHEECNSRLITKRATHLRDYADKNSCLIYGPSTLTTIPYNPSATPDVLDIAITKEMVNTLYLTTCSALSSDHLTVLIDTRCRSSFLSPPERPDLRTGWCKFQACLEAGLPSNPDHLNEVATDACGKNCQALSRKR